MSTPLKTAPNMDNRSLHLPGLLPMGLILVLLIAGCNGGGSSNTSESMPIATTDWSRDILMTRLTIDLGNGSAIANIELAGSTETTGASFEVGDLMIASVTSGGIALDFKVLGQRLDVGVPESEVPVTLTINYTYNVHDNFDGILQDGHTFTWPYFCSNVFPCKSSPDNGSAFELELTGLPAETEAVYAESIDADAPSYMIGWATGDYEYLDLGRTASGIQVGVYHLPGEQNAAAQGGQNLRAVLDWYEQTYGEYPFGSEVASVSVAWQGGGFGGIEHHPFWHISRDSISDQSVHAHEAAHGWFGNGVRIACWEEFVLSEGVASYLAARALSEVGGEGLGDSIWHSYTVQLNRLQNSSENKIAWPSGCNQVDILTDGLYGIAPYMKGAFFFRDIESVVGKAGLDQALRTFYTNNRGSSAGMQELLDLIESETGYDPTLCAGLWLRSEALPAEGACRY